MATVELEEVRVRRLIVLLIGAIILGKLFTGSLTSLSRASSARAPHLSFAKALDDHTNVGPLADANEDGAAPTAAVSKPWNLKVSHLPFNIKPAAVKKLAKAGPKKAAAEKEKARRKKRRKKLEEQVAQKPEAPKVNNVQVQFNPVAQPDYSAFTGGGGYFGQPAPASVDQTGTNTHTGTVYPYGGGTGASMNINYWKNLLSTNPTKTLMHNFVNMFNAKQITAAQFFSVLDAMEMSPVVLARQYAVQAAALYPSVPSFQIIADESAVESNPAVKALANQDLSIFGNAGQLAVLSQALASGDVNVKIAAASLIKTVVASVAGKSTPDINQQLSALVPLLQQLSVSNPQIPPTLTADAQADLQAIEAFLGMNPGTQQAQERTASPNVVV